MSRRLVSVLFAVFLPVVLCPATLRADDANLVEVRVRFLGKIEAAWGPLVLSPDGDRLAYIRLAADNSKRVVCDDEAGKAYDLIYNGVRYPIRFSPNGKRLAYFADLGHKSLFVCDGVERAGYAARDAAFSPDSRHVAWAEDDPGKDPYMVLDGKRVGEKVGAAAGSPVFSPDSRHLAFEVGYTPNRRLVVDGKQGRDFEDIGVPAFSPNSKRLAYAACLKDLWHVTCGSATEGPYSEVGKPLFSPDSQALAYRARGKDKWFIVCGKKKDPPFGDVRDPLFSPEGRHLAYAASDREGWFIVCDGKQGAVFTEVGTPVFSPDGEHVAYHGTRDGKTLVVCDGKDREEPGAVTWVGFSPDGDHLAFLATRGAEKLVVCDGVEGPNHLNILVPEHFGDVPGKLRYVVIDKAAEGAGNDAWLVEVDWPAGRTWEDAFKRTE